MMLKTKKVMAASLAALMIAGCAKPISKEDFYADFTEVEPVTAVTRITTPEGSVITVGTDSAGSKMLYISTNGLETEVYEADGKIYVRYTGDDGAQTLGWLSADELMSAEQENPMTAYNTLGELNKDTGFNMVRPSENAENETFYKIANGETPIAEYNFTVDGVSYKLRASGTAEDISGIYTGEGTLFENAEADAMMIGEYTAARWTKNNVQYCLAVTSGTVDETTFKAMVNAMKHPETIKKTTSAIADGEKIANYVFVETVEGVDHCTHEVDGKTEDIYFETDGDHRTLKETDNGYVLEYSYDAISVPEDLLNCEELGIEQGIGILIGCFLTVSSLGLEAADISLDTLFE